MTDSWEGLAALHRGRRWILALDVAAAGSRLVAQLQEWGADGVMVVAGAEGVGELPDCPTVYAAAEGGGSLMERLRAVQRALEHPSAEVLDAVDRFDPAGEARVLTMSFSTATTLFGRPVYGARRRAWVALEDKTIVDDLWDAADVARAPTWVGPVEEAPDATLRLAGPLGTVWVADNAEGWHGGADYTRWVSDPTTVTDAVSWFARHARRVRVMPFLDGLPCSIHGFVTGRGVAVFRPVEMVILRRADHRGFVYGGVATFWDPSDALREEMRTVVRRVAQVLVERVGYLGPFGIDGVATVDGFRPTELNPRLTAGIGIQTAGSGFPAGMVARAVIEGELDVDPGELEEAVVSGADSQRAGGMGVPLAQVVGPARTRVVFRDGSAVTVPGDDECDGVLEVGPAGAGGSYLRLRLDSDRIPAGPSVAPKAVAACRLATELWGADLPDVEPAPDLT